MTIFSIILAVGLGIAHPATTNFLVSIGLQWTFAFAAGPLIVLCASILTAISWLRSDLKATLRLIVSLISFAVILGLYLIINPPYIEDWSKEGESFNPEDFSGNSVELYVQELNPEFDGLVCVASVDCDHCAKAVRKLNTLQSRVPDLDLLVLLYTLDKSKIDSFRVVTDSPNLSMALVPDQDGTLFVTQGGFPTFLYVRDGEIIHRWHNDTFGFPAHTWVENRLN